MRFPRGEMAAEAVRVVVSDAGSSSCMPFWGNGQGAEMLYPLWFREESAFEPGNTTITTENTACENTKTAVSHGAAFS